MFLLHRRSFVGKYEALEVAAGRFEQLRCWDLIWEILNANYETPKWYEEPYLSELEDALEEALVAIAAALREVITLVPREAGVDVAAWKRALAEVRIDPAMHIFDSAKFSRLMKGRLHFYANAPPHFDYTWLIRNELGRIGHNFLVVPLGSYWNILTGEKMEDPAAVVQQLRGGLLTDAEADAATEYHRLTSGPRKEGNERRDALDVVEVFDGFFSALAKISDAVRKK
jgi:hypothetical protein